MIQTLLIVSISVVAAASYSSPDFVWRDYQGDIPNDAMQVGTDTIGPMFIGQVLYNNSLVPGKIYRNDPNIYFQFNHTAYSTDQNVQIFCTSQPEDYYWYPYKNSNFQDMTGYRIVNGGYQQGFYTFIGKIVELGETDVGRVICNSDSCLGLYTSKNGQSKVYNVYQVLLYYPVFD